MRPSLKLTGKTPHSISQIEKGKESTTGGWEADTLLLKESQSKNTSL